jgi:hypothetical protein
MIPSPYQMESSTTTAGTVGYDLAIQRLEEVAVSEIEKKLFSELRDATDESALCSAMLSFSRVCEKMSPTFYAYYVLAYYDHSCCPSVNVPLEY